MNNLNNNHLNNNSFNSTTCVCGGELGVRSILVEKRDDGRVYFALFGYNASDLVELKGRKSFTLTSVQVDRLMTSDVSGIWFEIQNAIF